MTLHEMLEVLADAIIEARTQNLIARDSGLSEKHVSQMLTGKVDGSFGAWQRMLDAAGLDLLDVLCDAYEGSLDSGEGS